MNDAYRFPDGPMGVHAAIKVRRSIAGSRLELYDLRRHLAQGGVDVPSDMALWPYSWLPRIRAWIERQLLLSPSGDGKTSP